MKELLIILFLLNPFILKSQDMLSKKELHELDKIINKKEISSKYDSLPNRIFTENRQQLQTEKKISKIAKLIVGNWSESNSARINGQLVDVPRNPDICFSSEGRFQTTRRGETVEGNYLITKEGNYNLILTFDEPQIPALPEEMLREMTKKEIQQLLYNKEFWDIFEIEKNQFINYQVIPIYNPVNPSTLTHSRLRLNYYIKN